MRAEIVRRGRYTASVHSELCHEQSPATKWANQPPEWLRIASPQPASLTLSLDAGERDAIALTLELSADLILLDEKQGRKAAQANGLKVAGTLAVILDAATRGLFDGEDAIDRRFNTNFYASAELLQAVRQKLTENRH
ncbi:MAG: hypothetical protein WD851_05540 [Pirellulales bacterium]